MRRLTVLLLLAVFLASVVQGQDEPGLTLTTLASGETITDHFEETFLAKLYSFDASAGDVVTITMTQISEDLDPYLVLLGASGEVLVTDDDSGDVLYSASIQEFEIPEDGDYLVLASTFEAIRGVFEPLPEPLEYEISLTGATVPEEGDTETVTLSATSAERGTNLQLEIAPDEPVYYLQFSGQAGELITIDVQSETFDTLLYLFGPDGLRVAASDDFEDTTNSRIENFELPEDGMYLIFATSYDFTFAAEEDWEGGGEFLFSVQ